MEQLTPRLLGDVGGTHARWAWQAAAGAPIEHVQTYPTDRFATIEEAVAHYLAEQRLPPPRQAAIGVATAVLGDRIEMTNHPWTFSISGLQRALGLERCLVLNDFSALALALPALRADERRAVGGGEAAPRSAVGLLGPGTGLGVSGLVPDADGDWIPLDGEGGHVTLAAADAREAALLAVLRERFDHVSAERVLSGPGLVNLHQAHCMLEGRPAPELGAAEITRRALSDEDADCRRTLADFAGFLGSVAGNLALTLGARGGVYVGGGIVPRLGSALDALPFRARFEDKGRFRDYLERIPTWVVTARTPGLTGAARALDRAGARA